METETSKYLEVLFEWKNLNLRRRYEKKISNDPILYLTKSLKKTVQFVDGKRNQK